MCPRMRAHRRHLVNTSELVLLRPTRSTTLTVNRSVEPFFAQLTEECRRADWRHLANTIELVHYLLAAIVIENHLRFIRRHIMCKRLGLVNVTSFV